jgi:gluconolactonase
VEIWREPSSYANGLAFDLEGRLLTCEGSSRRLTRTEREGSIITLAHSYEGKRLNTPNDLVVRTDGVVFFTDPVWALLLLGPELDFKGVYMLKPGDEPVLLVNDMEEPNGIGLSPDEKTLYVVDTKKKHVRAFGIEEDGSLSGGDVFVENIASADGMTTDTKGYVYITGHDGVTVCDQKGARLGLIETPQPAANCAFGGPDFKTLFITASKGLYSINMKFPGRAVWR